MLQETKVSDVIDLANEINGFFESVGCPYEVNVEAFRSIDYVSVRYWHVFDGKLTAMIENQAPTMAYYQLDSWFRGITFWMHVTRIREEGN